MDDQGHVIAGHVLLPLTTSDADTFTEAFLALPDEEIAAALERWLTERYPDGFMPWLMSLAQEDMQ